ncbi:MAG: ATP-binding protein [Sulfitobacter litoralis]|uniref:AlbA family DNA-binding domain-containing protein n=1 Tax=Sulfitobacter litoralis TaxID=335975 RepID=UPI0030012C2E
MANLTISDADFFAVIKTKEESLELEFKRTLDLSDNGGKAKLAKEICALANYGGGWIVFGRDDNGETVDELPKELVGIDQDMVNQISASYLTPAPHCTLRWIRDEDKDIDLPIVWVPSHGSEPICGAKNGPDDKGKITGIKIGTFYNRSAGPVSAPMSSPAEWKDVIRRCVLSDKTQLLSALSVMMSQPTLKQGDDESVLDADFAFIVDEWVKRMTEIDEEPAPAKNFVAFGFELVGVAELTIDQIKDAVRSMPSRDQGPHHFFEAGYHGEMAPHVIENAGNDGLQADITKDNDGNYDEWPSLWRISESGVGVSVGIYWEDSAYIKRAVEDKSSRTWERGSNIWMASQMASIDSFLSDIWSFAKTLEFQGQVRIRIVYNGLEDRTLNTPRSSMTYSRAYVSKQPSRTIDLTFQLDALEDSVRSAAVASIAQQLNKPFQGPAIDADVVLRSLTNYRRG